MGINKIEMENANTRFDVVFVTGTNHQSIRVRNNLVQEFKNEVKHCEYATKPYFVELKAGPILWVMEYDEYKRWCKDRWYIKDGDIYYNGEVYKGEAS